MVSFLYFIKRKKLHKDGTAPIFVRITVNKAFTEFSIGQSILPQQWIAAKGRTRNNTLVNKQISSFIDQLEYQLREIEIQIQRENKPLSSKEISKRYKGEDKTAAYIVSLYNEHNDRLKELVGNSFSIETYKRHCTSVKLFLEFIEVTYKTKDILVTEVDVNMLEKYKHYLMTVRHNNNNTTVKYLKNLGKILHQAQIEGYIQSSPLEKMTLRVNSVEKDFLTLEELTALESHKFEITRLDQVRNIFVFCSYTGLAYVDVFNLREEHLINDNQGKTWIRKERHKTNNMCNIPLLNPAEQILRKYPVVKGKLLPVLSNQKMNAYLKEIADIVGIKKELTTHCARHTFATTVTLANRVSMESVSKMLGHSSLRMTQQYAKILNESLAKEMANVDILLKGVD